MFRLSFAQIQGSVKLPYCFVRFCFGPYQSCFHDARKPDIGLKVSPQVLYHIHTWFGPYKGLTHYELQVSTTAGGIRFTEERAGKACKRSYAACESFRWHEALHSLAFDLLSQPY